MLWMVWVFLLKPVIVFSIAYILFRLAGKKAVSQMNNFDLLLTFAIGTIISEPILTSKSADVNLLCGCFFGALSYHEQALFI